MKQASETEELDKEPARTAKPKKSEKQLKNSTGERWDFDKPTQSGKQATLPFLEPSLHSRLKQYGNSLVPENPKRRFGLAYKAIYCEEETSYDGGSTDDEIYIIATVFDVDQGVSFTEKHPKGGNFGEKDVYEKFDEGEKRKGPGRYNWHTNSARTIHLTTCVFEKDEGDPEEVKEGIAFAAKVAEGVCAFFGCSGAPTLVSEFISAFFDFFGLGFEDDLIEQVETNIGPNSMARFLDQEDREEYGISYDFRTHHNKNEGAYYKVYWRFQWEE